MRFSDNGEIINIYLFSNNILLWDLLYLFYCKNPQNSTSHIQGSIQIPLKQTVIPLKVYMVWIIILHWMHSALGKLLNTNMVLRRDNFPKGKIEITCLNNSSEKQHSQKYKHVNSNANNATRLRDLLEWGFILSIFIQPYYFFSENTCTIFWILQLFAFYVLVQIKTDDDTKLKKTRSSLK